MGELRDEMAEAVASGTYTTRLPGKPAPQWCYDVAEMVVKIERERARQRIEALPGVITGMEYVHGVREGNSAIVMRADVLEALGGSDE